jgi:transcriptional regulator with XRE-family HTH domain
MKRPEDTFVFSPELGERLRGLRLKAGLTQMELARAMGRVGKKAGNLVGRIERGDERYPSLGLIADFLRGCRSGFADILDILNLYTDLPTTQRQVFGKALARVAASVPEKWQSQVTKYDLRIDIPKSVPVETRAPAKPDLSRRLERAKKMAAAARRRMLYGQFLKERVGKAGPHLSEIEKTTLFNHGLAWFAILFATRGKRPSTRAKRLAASEAWFAEASRLPLEVIRYVQDRVKEHFGEMEMRGDLDWLPCVSLDEYEASLLKPGRKRRIRDEQRREFARKIEEYEAARKAAVEQVWQEVQLLLDEANVPGERRPVYRGLVGACCTAALSFEPGSAGERKQLHEYILEPRWIRLGLDTALAQRLAGVMLARFRELAGSFPPDPRPKR